MKSDDQILFFTFGHSLHFKVPVLKQIRPRTTVRFCAVRTCTFLATIVVKKLKHIITFIVGDADQSHLPVEMLYSLVEENDGIQNVWASSPVPMTRMYISST